MKKYDLIIIGGGPAGLSAAIYGRRAGLSVLVLEKEALGGQVILTDLIENWPGETSINGYELGSRFKAHAEHFGAEFSTAAVSELKEENGRKIVTTANGDLEAGAVIIATGATLKRLNVAGENEFIGRGVSFCAVCDGPFFRDVPVAVVGGGNAAVEEAVYLTRFASKVYLVHRRNELRADRYISDKALRHEKITMVWDSVVETISGGQTGVERITLKNVKTGQESALDVAGAFIFIGTQPNTEFLKGFLDLEPGGLLKTTSDMSASRPGFFAAGDVREIFLRQVLTAAADGARAAMSAYAYLSK